MILQPVVSERVLAATPAVAYVGCGTAINGLVVQVDADATETAVTSGYYFDLQFPTTNAATTFPAMLGSGLTDGQAYPAVLSTPAPGATVVILAETGTNKDSIRATSGAVGVGGTIADFMIALPDDGATPNATFDVPVTMSVFFTDSNDARDYHQEIYYGAPVDYTPLGAAAATWPTVPTTSAANSDITNDMSGQSVAVKLKGTTIVVNDFIQFVLPTGTQLSSTSNGTSPDTYEAIARITSTVRTFAFPTILLKQTVADGTGAGIIAADVDIALSGITTRDADFDAGSTSSFQRPIMGGANGAVCEYGLLDFDWVATG